MFCADSGLELFGLAVACLAIFTAGRIFGASD